MIIANRLFYENVMPPKHIITLNANGIRSAFRKGLSEWVQQQNPDVLCIQETKAQLNSMDHSHLLIPGYELYARDAQKPGYSGVAIYTKKTPDNIHTELGFEIADHEGRFIQADFGNTSIVSLYIPSGSSGEVRQQVKFKFMDFWYDWLSKAINSKRDYIICGDWNTVHQRIDIKNWSGNQKNSGCLPEERAWIDRIFNQLGWVDAFRAINQEPEQYTWWSNRGQAWAKNVGWRIDYQIMSPRLKPHLKTVDIYKDQRFSDHAPLQCYLL